MNLAERGEVARGLHWMLEGLRLAPDQAKGLRRAVRVNLAAWSRRVHAPKRVFTGGPATVTSIVPHPDGRRVFAADSLGTVRSWDSGTGAGAGPDLAHPGPVYTIALSPDGQSLLAGGGENVTRIWRLGSEPKSTLLAHPAPVRFAAFSTDGQTVLTGCADGVARLWNAGTAALIREFSRGDPTLAAFRGAEEEWCLVEVNGGHVGIHRGAGGRQGTDILHGLVVTALAIAPDAKTILTAGEERLVRIWSTTDSRLIREISIAAVANSMAFTPDGRIVVVGDEHGEVRFWDARTGRSLGEPLAHPGKVKSLALGLDGLRVFAGLSDGSIWQWDLSPDLMIPPRDSVGPDAGGMAWPLDTQRAAAGPAIHAPNAVAALVVQYPVHTASLWDAGSQRPIGLPMRHAGWISALAFSVDGSRVATGSIDGTARIWDSANGRPITEPLRLSNYVQVVAFSPDGRALATGDYNRLVQLWDAVTGQRSGPPLRQPGIVWSLGFSPDGRTLAVGLIGMPADAPNGLLWDLAARKTLGKGMVCRGAVESIQFVGGGGRLWTRTTSEARLWDVATGQPIAPAVSAGVASLVGALAPDAAAMVTGTSEGTVRLWDAQTGRPIGLPIDVGRAVSAIAFGPAGDTFVVGTSDGTVRLFDRNTGKGLGPARVLDGAIIAVGFADLGRSIVATAAGTMPVRWPVPVVDDDVPADRIARRIEALTGRRMAADQSLPSIDPADRRAALGPDSATDSLGLGPGIASENLDTWDTAAARQASSEDDFGAALWHVGRLIARHPTHWLPVAERASIHLETGRAAEAAADYDRALSLGPADSVLDWIAYRAIDSRRHRRWRDALWYLDRLVEKRPGEGTNFLERSEVKSESGDEPSASIDRRRALFLGIAPDRIFGVAEDLARRGQWGAAASLLAGAGSQKGAALVPTIHQALIFAKAGDRDGRHRLGGEIQKDLASIPDGMAVNNPAWALALANDLIDRYVDPVVKMERSVAKVLPGDRSIFLNTLGSLLYRAGRHQDAIDRLMEGIRLRGGQEMPQDWAFLAMAAHKLGRNAEARSWMVKLRNWRGTAIEKVFWDNVEIEVLRDEAEDVFKVSEERGSGP